MKSLPFISGLMILLLSACSVSPVKDGAPRKRLEADKIDDAVPRAAKITAYGNKSPYTVNGRSYEVMTDYEGFTQRGKASWYGTKFHGRLTANGEPYSLYEMTAAHRTLPIPVYVRVTNLENGRTAVVRINDRGPFHDQRIIDLSYAAAVKLGFAEQGTAEVEIEVIDADNDGLANVEQSADQYFVQAGAFSTLQAASRLQARLEAALSHPVLVTETKGEPTFYRVRIGAFPDYLSARRAQQELHETWKNDSRIVSHSLTEERKAKE